MATDVPFCSICLQLYTENSIFPPNSSSTSAIVLCGHLFHTDCLSGIEAVEDTYVWGAFRSLKACPNCRERFLPERDIVRIYLQTTECEGCLERQGEIGRLREIVEENLAVNREVVVEPEPEPVVGDVVVADQVVGVDEEPAAEVRRTYQSHSSLRPFLGRIEPQAQCLNCEDPWHSVVDCEEPPFLRIRPDDREVNWVPMANRRPPGISVDHVFRAGEVINFYRNLGERIPITRAEVQTMFGFFFFDAACWKCGTPLHRQDRCQRERQVKRLCKSLHLHNHPLNASGCLHSGR